MLDAYWLSGSATKGVHTGTDTTTSFQDNNGGTFSPAITIYGKQSTSLLEVLNTFAESQNEDNLCLEWSASDSYPLLKKSLIHTVNIDIGDDAYLGYNGEYTKQRRLK